MTASSVSGYVLKFPADAMSNEQPVSSYRAWENRENLLHLTDEFAQHRINWVVPDSAGFGVEYVSTEAIPTWSMTYPHTWLAPNKPANLDLLVMGHDCYVEARLVPWNSPVIRSNFEKGNNVPATVFEETLDLSSATPTTDSYLHINGAASIAVFDTAWVTPGLVMGSDGIARRPSVCLMRLELRVLAETSARLFGVLLRELA